MRLQSSKLSEIIWLEHDIQHGSNEKRGQSVSGAKKNGEEPYHALPHLPTPPPSPSPLPADA